MARAQQSASPLTQTDSALAWSPAQSIGTFTAVGAIAGNAGKGAALGAVTGTMLGGGAQRSANAQAQPKAAAQAKAKLEKEHEAQKLAHEEGLDTFQRAFAACMDAREYSVK